MKSVTKRDLARDEIQAVLLRAFGESGQIQSTTEFTDGWFAAVHGAHLVNGQDVVLKASPPAELKLLRYEVDLANTEIEFYRLAAAAGVPVPAVRYADPDEGYLVTDLLRGVSLSTVGEKMPPEHLGNLRREIGRLLARLHTVTGPAFGYLRRDGHTQSQSWRTSFLTMMDDIVADAIEYQRELPAQAEDIAKLVLRNAEVLDEVTVPSLIHYDLWDGNVFVLPSDGGYTVEGFIDGERAFYGDPIAEFVSLGGIDNAQSAAQIYEGYFGEARDLTDSERLRLRLYTVYIDMIMLTEGAVRGYDPAEHGEIQRWVFGRLESNIAAL